MNTTIIVALIGVFGSIASAVLAVLIKSWLEQKRSIFKVLPPRRRDAISGRWVGVVHQAEGPYGPDPIEFDIEFQLRTDGITVEGYAFFEWESRTIELVISGGYIDDYYLKLEYKDADYTVLRYGTIILHISPDARKIAGRFVGYAAERGGLISGDVEVSKSGRFELSGRAI